MPVGLELPARLITLLKGRGGNAAHDAVGALPSRVVRSVSAIALCFRDATLWNPRRGVYFLVSCLPKFSRALSQDLAVR